MALPVAVVGAAGRMGEATCGAVGSAADLELVTRIGSDGSVADAVSANAKVVVDFTRPDVVMQNVQQAVQAGLHVVVGTSGFDERRLTEVRGYLDQAGAQELGVVVAPNFALGAVLLMRFAREAAAHFESVEIIELHHPDKVDAPSGTAVHTAAEIASARETASLADMPDATRDLGGAAGGARGSRVEGVPIHSVRLRGLVAHEEVLFGNPGEVLTVRHDSLDRQAFMPGVLLAIRQVVHRPGLTVGLESLLDL